MKKKLKLIGFSLVIILSMLGCSSKPSSLPTTYVNPMLYKNYECDDLNIEMDRVKGKVNNLYSSLDQKATMDQVQTGVGLLLFWPALFLLEGGDGPEAQQYSRLKGELEAMETVSVRKKCSINNDSYRIENIRKEYENSKSKSDKENS